MSSTRNRVALATAVGTALLAGGARTATRRRVRTERGRPDPEATFLAASPRADRTRTVTTADGVPLHVEEVGAADAPLTVVFAHGWTCTQQTWLYQRRDLAADDVRLVFYDQRGHGKSGRPDGDPEHSSIDVLGSDLLTVLEAVVPIGPVVLVGHSMGGMTIMAMAEQHPELFAVGGRVAGVALLATSAGKVASLTLGLPALAAKGLQLTLPRTYRLLERVGDRVEDRRRTSDLSWLLTRRVGYGGPVPPSLVALMEAMMAESPLAVTAAFGTALLSHDKLAALPVLDTVPVLIMVGDADLLTPLDRSREMAEQIPTADLVVEPGAGHMVMLERPARTTAELGTLLDRARAAGRQARETHAAEVPDGPQGAAVPDRPQGAAMPDVRPAGTLAGR